MGRGSCSFSLWVWIFMCLQVPMCVSVCEWRWRSEISDTVRLGFETGSLACTCGLPRSLWARPGICQSLPLWTRISRMHHHAYLVMLKLKTEFRSPCLHGKCFTPKLNPHSKSWVLKLDSGAWLMQVLRDNPSFCSWGALVRVIWVVRQIKTFPVDESTLKWETMKPAFQWKCLLHSWNLTQLKTL